MKITEVGTRGLLFSFPFKSFDTQIYVIIGKKNVFMCDTGHDPAQIREVKNHLDQIGHKDKRVIVLTPHYYYHHSSGTGALENAIFISSDLTYKRLKEELENNIPEYSPEIKLPSLTFAKRLEFVDEGVEFFLAPGIDEQISNCYDKVDKVLYAGDNLIKEYFPIIDWHEFDVFFDTLNKYLEMDAEIFIPAHDGIIEGKDHIRQAIKYIDDMRNLNVDVTNMNDISVDFYIWNLISLGESLKKAGREEEGLKYLRHVKSVIIEYNMNTEKLRKMSEEHEKLDAKHFDSMMML